MGSYTGRGGGRKHTGKGEGAGNWTGGGKGGGLHEGGDGSYMGREGGKLTVSYTGKWGNGGKLLPLLWPVMETGYVRLSVRQTLSDLNSAGSLSLA